MKYPVAYCVAACLVLLYPGAATSLSAPPEIAPKTAMKPLGTNTIPQSVFSIPGGPGQGRDPFFPDSRYWLRGHEIQSSVEVATRPRIDAALILNGLSGTADRKLAMINGKTVAEGEEIEVTGSAGRVKVRCLQINTNSVLVEIDGDRQELVLRE